MVHPSMPRFVGISCNDPFSVHIYTTTYGLSPALTFIEYWLRVPKQMMVTD